jgi:hypothetical protein
MTDNDTDLPVFVSYSRLDEALLRPIIEVMRAVGRDVFRDVDSIPYGSSWRAVISEAIATARMVFVFWCAHSQRSSEVRAEWEFAVLAKRSIVPTLLDDTPLHPRLGEYQALDLRSLAVAHMSEDVGTRRLLPGTVELWKHRNIRSDAANHLAGLDDRYAYRVAMSLLAHDPSMPV